MAKAKTLVRQKKSSESTLKLKKGVKLTKHDPFKALLDEKLIAQAFWECLKENDPEGAMEILSAHLMALNKSHLAKEAEMPRSTLYHSLKSKNPTIKIITAITHDKTSLNARRPISQPYSQQVHPKFICSQNQLICCFSGYSNAVIVIVYCGVVCQ